MELVHRLRCLFDVFGVETKISIDLSLGYSTRS